ncbi:tRNA (adenine(22)-N(1))-methyltransferase [Vaginisenegalia massiliensis]|uniref:tRNA (adenine(22)-N(1))-methyltransferase n=1 Tax=Vaginisenegalia massiliensis TaxID=2058294 RepID=UPI000F52324D|nr:tRNA (adenine(22)-N(1))-methyltransferase TrmK [Vaginisenegalia massiliensis]
MNSQQLSARLNQVADFIIVYGPQGRIRLADIGSDHAYLPCYLGLKGALQYAVAGEVVQGPYQSALAEVHNQALEKLIQVRMGDGLDVIKDQDKINCVSICGMGGSLICDILTNGRERLDPDHTLFLQANIGEAGLRKWLVQHHYQIIDEAIVEDHHRLYEMLVARPSQEDIQLTEAEYLFGPINLQQTSPLLFKKWRREATNLQRIYQSISQANQRENEKMRELEQTLALISNLIGE